MQPSRLRRFGQLALFCAVGLAAGCSTAADNAPPQSVEPLPYRLAVSPKTAIPEGESLRYGVSLLFLSVGQIDFEAHWTEDPEGPVLRMTMVNSPRGLAAALTRYGGYAVSWMNPDTLLPRRYTWNNPYKDELLRRFNVYKEEEGRISCVQIEGGEWESSSIPTTHAADPASLLTLLRFVDLKEGDVVRLRLVEGLKERLVTLRGLGEDVLRGKGGTEIPTTRIGVRVDRLRNGELRDEPPETDMESWIAQKPPRVILKSRGKMGGVNLTIRLEERKIVEKESAGALPPAESRVRMPHHGKGTAHR
ncbi:MAG TPA: DUF3108 domain-containing protein [Planctomycetes bacterium]|nr:DUF3108 domain-containing protein [Planctomycetota bacterium]